MLAPVMAMRVLVFPVFAFMPPLLTAQRLLPLSVITPLVDNRCRFVIDGSRLVTMVLNIFIRMALPHIP